MCPDAIGRSKIMIVWSCDITVRRLYHRLHACCAPFKENSVDDYTSREEFCGCVKSANYDVDLLTDLI